MTTTYRLNVNELSQELINSIKAAFKGKEVEIVVTEAVDETDYLLSSEANKTHLESSLQLLEEGQGNIFTIQKLQEKFGN